MLNYGEMIQALQERGLSREAAEATIAGALYIIASPEDLERVQRGLSLID